MSPTGLGKPGVGVYLNSPLHPVFANGLWVEQVIAVLIAEVRAIIRDAQNLIDDNGVPMHLALSAAEKRRARVIAPVVWPSVL